MTAASSTLHWSNDPISIWDVVPKGDTFYLITNCIIENDEFIFNEYVVTFLFSVDSTGLATGVFVLSKSPTAQPTSPTYVIKSSMAVIDTPPPLVYMYTTSFSPIDSSQFWTPSNAINGSKYQMNLFVFFFVVFNRFLKQFSENFFPLGTLQLPMLKSCRWSNDGPGHV